MRRIRSRRYSDRG